MRNGIVQDFDIIPSDLLQDIYEKYESDFQLFGYSRDINSKLHRKTEC